MQAFLPYVASSSISAPLVAYTAETPFQEHVCTVYSRLFSSLQPATFRCPEQAFRSDLGAALEEPSPCRYGRGYVAYWETRNLRMASNIRDAMTVRPGMRVLVVVGASHKRIWKPTSIKCTTSVSSPPIGYCAPNKTRRDRLPNVAYLS
ncbi:DUF5694 domain-containing protein [Oxalobacteraceae bacterium OTU3CAMAD1]|nr:DUF5694 domain-containing protein [Oxalobacteraceae bacterium OTU3CAMAD1]